MALQRLNWLQIETETVQSGSIIDLGSESGSIHAIYADNLYISGQTLTDYITQGSTYELNQFTSSLNNALETTGSNLTIKGNLTVKGVTTSVESNTIDIGSNLVELNGHGEVFGGLLVRDATNPNLISGSLLWDGNNNNWIAGISQQEEPIVLLSQLMEISSSLSQMINDTGIWKEIGSRYHTTNDLELTGSLTIKGDLKVEGGTVLVQTSENKDTLTVSGAMSLVNNLINNHTVSASLSIQNLGTLSGGNSNSVIDCGDGFF